MNKISPMTHKERVLAAVNHQPVDKSPTDIWAVPEIWNKLEAHFDTQDRIEIYDQLGIDGVIWIDPKYIGPPTKKEDGYCENEWGFGCNLQNYQGGEYCE
jgi:uroporphyrinogen decarboxylase